MSDSGWSPHWKKNILYIVAMDSSCTIYLLALWNTLSLNEHILCFDGEMQSSYESRIWQYETIFYFSLEAGWLCEFEMVLTIYFLSVMSSFIISRSLSVCRSWCWVVLREGWCGKSLRPFLHPACAQWHQQLAFHMALQQQGWHSSYIWTLAMFCLNIYSARML